jgi:serine/threonine-protein kinase
MSDGSPPLAPGALIADSYEVERKLGQGGMGEVWLARHRRLAGKQVAIKVLHVDRALPAEALARFKREAEIAARLEHPNIVQVSDFNMLPTGQPFLVMEYLKGQSLAARARGGVLPVEQLLLIMRQVGAALQAAHRAGVVHRDLKPDNIFLVPTALGDQVKVLDFGISKLSDSSTVQTTDSVLIGTPLYMSPEQALGNNKDITPQSDVFSLGSICYELLTGQPPFLADNLAKIVFRIAYEPHRPLAELRPDLPPAVLGAIEHALQKDRAKRTPGIEAFVLELTGQALSEVAATEDESSGVYTPGMALTPSMLSGATLAPATPAPGAQSQPAAPPPAAPSSPVTSAPPAPTPTPPPTVSGKVLIIGLGVVVLALAAIVTKVRMGNWAERAAYRAGMIDAGYVMLPDGTFVRDAGVAAAVVDAGAVALAAPVDAGPDVAEAPVDAGAEVAEAPALPDAGARAVAPRAEVEPKVAPATPAELELLATLERHRQAREWERLSELRLRVFNDLRTPTATAQGLNLLLEGLCERRDLVLLRSVIPRVRALGPAQVRKAKALCVARYPDADALDW